MLRCEDVEVTSGTLWMLRCEDVEAESNWWNPGVGSNLGWFEVFLAKTTLNTSADRRPIEVATQQVCVGLAVETPQNWTWLGFTAGTWKTHEIDQQEDRILELSRPQM